MLDRALPFPPVCLPPLSSLEVLRPRVSATQEGECWLGQPSLAEMCSANFSLIPVSAKIPKLLLPSPVHFNTCTGFFSLSLWLTASCALLDFERSGLWVIQLLASVLAKLACARSSFTIILGGGMQAKPFLVFRPVSDPGTRGKAYGPMLANSPLGASHLAWRQALRRPVGVGGR